MECTISLDPPVGCVTLGKERYLSVPGFLICKTGLKAVATPEACRGGERVKTRRVCRAAPDAGRAPRD